MVKQPRRDTLLRLLRISCSAFFATLCLVIAVFWVRSYWYVDSGLLKILPSEYVQFSAGDARMCVWFEHKPIDKWADWWSNPITTHTPPNAENRIPWFNLAFWPTFARLYTAHWFLAVVAATLAAIPWCPRRFSVRGMMITVTVLASIAALISWIDRTF